MAGLITTLTLKCLLFLLHHICISEKNMRIIKYDLKNTHENILSVLEKLFSDFVKFFRKGFAQLFKC